MTTTRRPKTTRLVSFPRHDVTLDPEHVSSIRVDAVNGIPAVILSMSVGYGFHLAPAPDESAHDLYVHVLDVLGLS